ncbi:MAG: sugar phosphate isomerase/epimerase [Planctomycetes bacterium]|nr:sugar phosphate isomerase/epimerase [Planctomycetota bacterium]
MRYAICNETFEGWDHARTCKTAAELGYTGLEIAPFTLAPRITDVTAAHRKQLKQEAEAAGLQIIGLHWLLAKTEGLQLTSPDVAIRQRTADYLVELARACRDLGGDLMVFGSPAQRRIPAGATREHAVDFAVDTFKRAQGGIADAGVRLCLEPLAPTEADFIQTAAEACDILDRLAHPSFVLHLDVKAMSSETIPIPELIRTHAARTGHFHANDANRRGPGFGAVDFVPIFRALKETNYSGWVSVEVFDYTPDPVTIARESIRYMRECESRLLV